MIAPDIPIAVVSPNNRSLRSRLPESEEINRLVITAKMPEIAIPCPAIPSVTSRSLAMGVNKLTGKNSEVTNAKAQIDNATTPLQQFNIAV